MLFLYLDLSRTTGTDVKRPLQDRAGLTIGKEQTLTDSIQAAMRERQLLRDDGQNIVWVLFKSLYAQINPGNPYFDLNQIMLWMIRNQAKNDEQKILARAYQGIDQLMFEYVTNNRELAYHLHSNPNPSLFSKSITLSMWALYELESKDVDTATVLNRYIDSLCEKIGKNRSMLPVEIKESLERIVGETKVLIPHSR